MKGFRPELREDKEVEQFSDELLYREEELSASEPAVPAIWHISTNRSIVMQSSDEVFAGRR